MNLERLDGTWGAYHNVSVGSSETKAIDTCPTLADRPRLLASGDFQTPLVEGYVLVRILEVVVR
jgi:hypothetical protein